MIEHALLAGNRRPYKKTAVFDETTIPDGLRRRHSTKPGVWAVIRVIEGRLRYCLLDTGAECVIDAAHPAVSRPGQMHAVEPLGSVRFFLEFHAALEATPDRREEKVESAPKQKENSPCV